MFSKNNLNQLNMLLFCNERITEGNFMSQLFPGMTDMCYSAILIYGFYQQRLFSFILFFYLFSPAINFLNMTCTIKSFEMGASSPTSEFSLRKKCFKYVRYIGWYTVSQAYYILFILNIFQ